MAEPIRVTIILNDMERTDLAVYGFRSWLLQEVDFPYEVVLVLFNDRRERFDVLCEAAHPQCVPRIHVYDPPEFFNISAANNLGLHAATGRYVLFANSDIIYPSHYLRSVVRELETHQLAYLQGSRINLTPAQTQQLRPVGAYTPDANFDGLVGRENRRKLITGSSPWVVRRDIARNIGGFDANVLCHEDSDFNDRVMHYLRRHDQQHCLYAICDLFGYHLAHAASELYDLSTAAKAIVEARRERLRLNPQSTEDIVPTPLDGH